MASLNGGAILVRPLLLLRDHFFGTASVSLSALEWCAVHQRIIRLVKRRQRQYVRSFT